MSDKYYVAGCVDNGLSAEVVEDEHAEFWTLYERDSEGLSEAIIDCVSRKEAETAMAVYVERDRLNEQVRALAAEVQSCRQFVAEHLGPDAEIEFAGLPLERSDAVLREVGARAVEGFGDHVKGYNYSASWQSKEYAARIRAGEVPDV